MGKLSTFILIIIWKDTVQVVVLDVNKRSFLMNQDRRDQSFLLHVQNHWQELINNRHLHIATIIPRNQGLRKKEVEYRISVQEAYYEENVQQDV